MNDHVVTDQANKRLEKLGLFMLDRWSLHLAASAGNKGRLMTAEDERRVRLASVLFCITASEEFERIGRIVLAKQLSTVEANKALRELRRLFSGLSGVLMTLTRSGAEDSLLRHVLGILRRIFETLSDFTETQTWYKDSQQEWKALFGNEFFKYDVRRAVAVFYTLRPRLEPVDKEETRGLQRDVEHVKKFYERKTKTHDTVTPWGNVELE